MSFEPWGALTEAEIERRVREYPYVEPPTARGFRPAAVLIPLAWRADEWHLLFTRRTETVQNHKGQVSFPGGAAEPEDLTPEKTALREAFEEIGLSSQDVRILGRLGRLVTVSHFFVTPILARIPFPYHFQLSKAEVSRVFTIPLNWLADPAHYEERSRTLSGGAIENVIYFQPYDGERLWGISARITVDFLETLKPL